MSEKYIDLIHAIESSDRMVGCERVTVEAVLAWLDAHRGQVPGRTITRHDFERAFDFHFDDEDIDRHERFLAHLGITVVPDPEPTNTEKLASYVLRITDDLYIGLPQGEIDEIAEALDKAGVTAPGANDEH